MSAASDMFSIKAQLICRRRDGILVVKQRYAAAPAPCYLNIKGKYVISFRLNINPFYIDVSCRLFAG